MPLMRGRSNYDWSKKGQSKQYSAWKAKRAYASRIPAALSRNKRTGGYVGKELKYVDYEYDAVLNAALPGSEADPATVLCLNASATGSGASARDGRRQWTQSIHVWGSISWTARDTTTIGQTPFVTLILLQDQQTNAVQFSSTGVLLEPSNSDMDATAFRNLNNTHRYKILKRFILRKPSTASFWDGDSGHLQGVQQPFKINYKFKTPMVTTYVDDTAVIGSIADNSLHMMAIQCADSAGSLGSLRYVSRCRFTSG